MTESPFFEHWNCRQHKKVRGGGGGTVHFHFIIGDKVKKCYKAMRRFAEEESEQRLA